MRPAIVALLSGVAAVAFALSVFPADAAPKKRATVSAQKDVAVSSQRRRVVRSKQTRTRITVRRRSYLDAGTEVLPGERKYNDYALPPGYVPSSVITGYQGQFATQSPWSSQPGLSLPY
jgi:hypothetical protein